MVAFNPRMIDDDGYNQHDVNLGDVEYNDIDIISSSSS